MNSTRYILPASAAALAVALVVLVLKVRATPAVDVDDRKLANAEAAYKRQATGTAPAGTTRTIKKPSERSDVVRATPRVNTAPPAPAHDEPPQDDSEDEDDANTRLTFHKSPEGDLQAKMNVANKAYDRGDYPTAEEAALEILKDHPRNIRMLRVVVSTSCIMGNPEQAKEYVEKLPARDQTQMRTRCSRWNVELPDPEQE